MRHLRDVGLAVLVLASTASTVLAQRTVRTSNAPASADKFWEFGADLVGIRLDLDPGDQTAIGIGSGDLLVGRSNLRVGRSIATAMTIEPSVLLVRSSGGGTSGSLFGTEVGLLYHFQADRAARQFYVRPLLVFQRTSSDNGTTSTSDSNMGFGVGGGVKLPSKKNSRFTWRGEVTYRSVDVSGTSVSDLTVSGGVSVYNR